MRIRPVALAALAMGALAVLWQYSQSHRPKDSEFITHRGRDGALQWALVMPSDKWGKIRQAAGGDRQGEDRALKILLADAFSAAQLAGDGCRVLDISPMVATGKVKIEGSCRPDAIAGGGTSL